MKAYVSGGHYHLHIDKSKEFPFLINKSFKTNLQDGSNGSDLGKKVLLNYNPKKTIPIIYFVPPESDWDKLKEIRVTITKEQYERMEIEGLDIIRVGGGSSIDLHLEDNLDGFM